MFVVFEKSLERFQFDYLDLYLIYWSGKDKYKDIWCVFEKLYKDGKICVIGVSNF